MGEMFHGWRRKVGVPMLILACLFGGLWIRSLIVLDYIEIPVGKHTTVLLVTHSQFFALFVENDPEFDLSSTTAKWISQATSKFPLEDLVGMNYGEIQMILKYRNHPLIVPKEPNQPIGVPQLDQDYWLFGLPLTYLLVIALTLI